MNTPIWSVAKAGFRFTGMVLASAIIGTGSAGADTYRHGGSTAITKQSGGSGPTETQVSRYQDGQTIIRQDGSSTDITIQRGVASPPPAYSWEYPRSDEDRFDRRSIEERFSSIDPGERGADAYSEYGPPSTDDEFKRRMMDRMDRHLEP